MFSMDTFDFETAMTKHLFDGHPIHTNNTTTTSSSHSSDFLLCDEYSSDDGSDIYSGFNSDQENTDDKLWVFHKETKNGFKKNGNYMI